MSKLIDINALNKNNNYINNNITEIKDYIGYTDNDIYGLEVDYENGIFTRLAGAIDKTGGADFDNVNAYGGRRRCNLTDNGVVTAYYGDTAYTETGALTQAVTVNGTEYPIGTAVQVMVEQPKFYYKVVPLKLEKYTTQNGDIGYHIRKARYYISDTPKNGFKLHPAFIRNGAEKEKIYLSAYEGSLYDVSESAYITDDAQVADFNTDKLSSIANVKPMSGLTQNLTRANARKLAQNRGLGWEQMYIHTASATQLLFMIEYGTLNSQQAIGNGVINKAIGSGNESENTGGTSTLGNESGSVANNEVSYRGEENFWGNLWKWQDGINILNPNLFNDGEYGNVYVADNGFADNTNLLPYEDTDIYPCKTGGGWISAFGYNEKFNWLFIPTEVKSNSSLPVGDMVWNPNAGWRITGLSGGWYDGPGVGIFCLRLDSNFPDRYRTIGSRLVYIPDASAGVIIQSSNDKLQLINSEQISLTSKDCNINIGEAENISMRSGDEFTIYSGGILDLYAGEGSDLTLGTSNGGMISLDSDGDISLGSNSEVTVQATYGIGISAPTDAVNISGDNINLTAGGNINLSADTDIYFNADGDSSSNIFVKIGSGSEMNLADYIKSVSDNNMPKNLETFFADEISNYSNKWQWIKARIQAGNFNGINIGDYLTFTAPHVTSMQQDGTITNSFNITYHAQVAGINTHKSSPYPTGNAGTTTCDYSNRLNNHIDFVTKECCTSDNFYWSNETNPNDDYTNNGTSQQRCPYLLSQIYQFYQKYFDELPSDLKAVIIPKTIHLEQRYLDTNRTAEESTDVSWNTNIGKCWTFTEFEFIGDSVWGTPQYSNRNAIHYPLFDTCERRQMIYYSDANNNWNYAYPWLMTLVSGSYYGVALWNGYHCGLRWNNVDFGIAYPLGFRIGVRDSEITT